ncbi:ParA family protein [Anaerococcus sp. mt242]|uniref:ParA family protein n=1 Tax=Anaerococcus sp. mt242 TaxID=2661917 RepID=UPI001931FB8B|nr:ParA family protein [Anaerococcus sp. mt242]MBM0046227.1 ParA family protein [Anaerococcus sp. mt242]
MRVISVFNQKGGVGKTTTVVNLAVALNYLDKKVLVIDIDPQSNTTTGLGLDKYKIDNSLYELFYANEENPELVQEALSDDEENKEVIDEKSKIDDENTDESLDKENGEESSTDEASNDEVHSEPINIEDFITKTKSGVDLIPSESALSGLEVELVELDALERTQQLKNIMGQIDPDKYDFVLIDCPPSLGLLSINALVASNSIIIPIQTEYYALEGVSELMNTYNMVKKQLNTDLEIEGVLLSMFDKRAVLSYEVVEEVKSYFKTNVFKVMIPRNPRLAEAPSHGLSTIEYDSKSQGSVAYIALANEIINNTENRKGE